MFKNASGAWVSLSIVSVFILSACAPTPRLPMTAEEKTADMYWIYSQFDQNYAPLEMKEAKWGFQFDDLKQKYLAKAVATQTNEDFYSLMFNFVAQFHDAHTSASLTNSTLPGRTELAYLGFAGNRHGNNLRVTKILPTIDPTKSDYPIQVNDVITQLDGKALNDIVLNEMTQFRNLGEDESNLTYHMNKIFNRSTLQNGLPAKDTATLTVVRGKQTFQVTLPWVMKDLITFTKEQDDAAKAAAAAAAAKNAPATPATPANPETTQLNENVAVYDILTSLLSGDVDFIPAIIKNILPMQKTYGYLKQFQFIDDAPTWDSPLLKKTAIEAARDLNLPSLGLIQADTLSDLKTLRTIPDESIMVDAAVTFPTYIHMETLNDDKGNPVGPGQLVATMYLNTFEPAGDEDAVVKEVAETLKTLQENGVKNLVIDLLDNGGGSLTLGIRLAQLLSPTKIQLPEMQMRLSDTWLDEFQQESIEGASDTDREQALRVFDALTADSSVAAQRLSRNISIEKLVPSPLLPNSDLNAPFNVALLTNEMCASMCDIFSAILKDNGLAKVVGAKTMGAGGNVVDHYVAPISHLILRQTESLIVRKGGAADGKYIENDGVEPDLAVTVNETEDQKYSPVRDKAVQLLLGATASPASVVAVAAPTPAGSK